MGMWTAIAVISIAAICGEAYRRRNEGKGSEETEQTLQDLEERMTRLEKDLKGRIEVLERIVTDRTEDLKRQFDHLDKAS